MNNAPPIQDKLPKWKILRFHTSKYTLVAAMELKQYIELHLENGGLAILVSFDVHGV